MGEARVIAGAIHKIASNARLPGTGVQAQARPAVEFYAMLLFVSFPAFFFGIILFLQCQVDLQ